MTQSQARPRPAARHDRSHAPSRPRLGLGAGRDATVHPGVQAFTAGAQCTSNFVFQEGSTVYLGQAAHCSGTGGQTETDGCTSGSLPLGTPVEVTGASKPGTLAYNSWLTMQAAGETDPDTCAYNDLALIRIDPADVGKVNPSVPGFGGPTGVGTVGDLGSTVFSYGNSELRGGITKLSPKQGIVVQNEGGGWSHIVVTLTPGVPGDSGSGFMNESGPGDRRPQHPAAGAAGRHQRGRRPRQGARLRPRPRLPGPAAGARHRAVQRNLVARSSAPRRSRPARRAGRRGRGVVPIRPPPPRRRPRPLLARAVPVELDPVAVGVVEVERLADAVVGGALERHTRPRSAAAARRRGRGGSGSGSPCGRGRWCPAAAASRLSSTRS